MKASSLMKTIIQQLATRHGLDLAQSGAFLRLDMPGHDSLVIEVIGPTEIAVTKCFEETGAWKIDREVIFFTGYQADWLPIELTQLEMGWCATAKLDGDHHRLLQINHGDQERLAAFAERWAKRISQQNWLEQGEPYQPWTPPWRKESQ